MNLSQRRIVEEQYAKIFVRQEIKPNVESKSKHEKFDDKLIQITEDILNMNLGIEEFDSLELEISNAQEYTKEDFLAFIDQKFKLLVEILDKILKDYTIIENENLSLQEKLSYKLKQTDAVRNRLENELLYHHTKQREISEMKFKKVENNLRHQDGISAKENNIFELNKNIKKMMDDYVYIRERILEQEKRVDIFLNEKVQYENELNELANIQTAKLEIIREKSKDYENLYSQEQVLLLKLKQREKKYNSSTDKFQKSNNEIEKTNLEYTKTLEKNSANIKRIQDIEKLKDEIRIEIEKRTEELERVRIINSQFEERLSTLPILETTLKSEEQLNNYLLKEQNLLSQEVEELAPHSMTGNKLNEDLLVELSMNADLEKYTDMDSEDILNEIEHYRMQSANLNENISRLKTAYQEKNAYVNRQKFELEKLRDRNVTRIEDFQKVKEAREDLEKRNQELAFEVAQLIENFNRLPGIMDENDLILSTEEDEIENTMNYKFSFNQPKDETIPKPLELHVTPSSHDLKETETISKEIPSPPKKQEITAVPRGTPTSSKKKDSINMDD